MKRILLALALLGGLACRKPAPTPSAARLKIHFLDQDAVVGLDRPIPGAWSFMDAGRWTPMDTIWTSAEGRAVVGRTAPKWVMVQDPEGAIHRVELSNAPDAFPSNRSEREDTEDQAAGLFFAWLWFSRIITGR